MIHQLHLQYLMESHLLKIINTTRVYIMEKLNF